MKREALWQTIGQNVFHYRKAAGLTQEQLAERIGLSPGTISKVERGDMAVMTATLCNIAHALHVTCDTLIYPQTSTASAKNIERLLAGQPDELVADIEGLVRYCVANFEHKPRSGRKK